MRATINFADLSTDRPSLAMRFLAAIGPGTVLCKTSSLDIRHDGTSLALLRARLPHYAFLPVPSAHYVREDSQAIGEAHAAFVERKISPVADDAAALEFLRKEGLDPGHVLREWKAQLDLPLYGTAEFADRLRGIYQVPQTGPLIVVGSPETYLGYPPADHSPEQGPHDTELAAVLLASGYSRRFRSITPAERSAERGIIELEPTRRHHLITPPSSRPFVDVGVIHLGRTPAGRTVMVVAGSSHPFGTLGGMRICCDHGRNTLQRLVAEFAAGNRKEVALVYRVRPQVGGTGAPPMSATAPIDAEIICDDEAVVPLELSIREAEARLAPLEPAARGTRQPAGLLARHLTRRGGVSVVVKTYPVDRRDDSTAKNLLEAVLPGVREVPVPENVPHHRVPSDDDAQLAAGLADVRSRAQKPGSIVATIAKLDGEWWRQVEHWSSVIEARRKGSKAFKAFVDEAARLPASGPLVILGDPRSFLGADAVSGKDAAVMEADDVAVPQLAALLDAIRFPNRFELAGLAGDQSLVIDHKMLRRSAECGANGIYRNADVGLVYLTRGPEDRDILVIAGNDWLGTLAGVQLLFAERRPVIDRAIQDYIAGRRRCVDIGYRCHRIELRDAPEGSRFPMVHPSVDLEVKLLDEAGIDEPFTRSDAADRAFRPLWELLGTVTDGAERRVGGDGAIELRLSRPAGRPVLSVHCKSCLQLRAVKDRQEQMIFRSLPTATLHDEFVDHVRQSRRTFFRDLNREAHRCYCFLVVGPPGSGKESMGALLQKTLGGRTQLEQANVAGLPESLMLSALFGHGPGAFTGAGRGQKGLFEKVPDGGVMVLDEFAAGSAALQQQFQPTLLRFLQFGTGHGVGCEKPFYRRLFLLASTNEAETLAEVAGLVRDRRVRADLIDRFSHRFELPPLRARPLEILPTFVWMLYRARGDSAAGPPPAPLEMSFEHRALERLLHHPWPGNFRQLEQVAERLAHELDTSPRGPIRDAALAHSLGMTADVRDDDQPAKEPTVIDVRVTWLPEESTPVKAAGPWSPATGPNPPKKISWPQKPVTIRGLATIKDASELCKRLVAFGARSEGRPCPSVYKAHAAEIAKKVGDNGGIVLRMLDEKQTTTPQAEQLAAAVLKGIVRVGLSEVRSSQFSAPFLARRLLVALAAGEGDGQERRVDPQKAEQMTFPLEAVFWAQLWKHLQACNTAPRISEAASRLLRDTTLLLLTGVDVRSEELLLWIEEARDIHDRSPPRPIQIARPIEPPRTREL